MGDTEVSDQDIRPSFRYKDDFCELCQRRDCICGNASGTRIAIVRAIQALEQEFPNVDKAVAILRKELES